MEEGTLNTNSHPSYDVTGFRPRKGKNEDSQRNPELQAAIDKGVEASRRWPKSRTLRVDKLKGLVEANAYQVDCRELAECILKNDARFYEAH